MKTITIDILNERAMRLLQDLEFLHIIRIRKEERITATPLSGLVAKYKGSMRQQSIEDVDKQLNELRNEWE